MIIISVVHGMCQAVDLISGPFLLLRPRPETQSVLLWIKLPVMALMITIRLNQATFVWPGVRQHRPNADRDRAHNEFAYLLHVNNSPLKSENDKCSEHAFKIVSDLPTTTLHWGMGLPALAARWGSLKLEKVNYFEAHFSGLSSKVWESCCEMSRSTHTALAV